MSTAKTPVNSDEALRDIKSIEDAMRLFESGGVDVVEYSEEFGTEYERLGFERLDANGKARLVGVPFYILGYQFSDGKNGQTVTVAVMTTEDGNKFAFSDSGTGILTQCREMELKGRTTGIKCSRGLRRSEYEFVDDKGNRSPAVTYYLS